MESTPTKKFRGSRSSRLLARIGMAAIGSAAVLSVGAATTPAGAATAPYKTASFDLSVSFLGGLGHVNLQGEYKYNGHDVYQVGSVYCTPSGYGMTVTWCGATGGGNGDLTFGFNESGCIGPDSIGCITGGFRAVVNTSGNFVNAYTF
jgi:hypothetical protein